MVSHLPGRRLRERWCNAAEFNGNILFSPSDPHSDSNTYTYTFTYGYTNGDTHTPNADSNCDSDSHTDCNADNNCNSLSRSDSNAKRDDSTGKSDSNPTRSAYSGPAPVASALKKKHTAQFGSFNLQLVLCSAAVCSTITGTLLAFLHPEAPAKASQRMQAASHPVLNTGGIYCGQYAPPTPTPSPTPTLIVTNTNDSGPGSLRQTLADANNGDVIGFAVTGTIGLTTGELLVTRSITISGPGAENLAVNGNNQSRVLHIASGQTVTISGLTITNGHATDSGGGLYNDHAALTLNNCVVSDNSATGNLGGGIHNDGKDVGHATLQINNCLITNNSGGIYNDALQAGTATLVITYSTLSNNGPGEAINNDGWSCTFCGNGTTSVEITDSSITSNPGGAIYSDTGRQNCGGSCPVTISITNSTISGNGGGVRNSTLSDTVVSNSTISDNGSGIYNDNGAIAASVYNTTMSNNGVEIQNFNAPVLVAVSHTIFNVSPGGHSILNDFGTVTSYGYNVSSDDGGGYLNGTGDQINADPMLGPLQDNGGPTFTHALLPGSPAINAGNPNFTPPPFFDQRGPGFDRVVNGRIDIGSFEVQEGPTPTATPTPTPRPSPTPRSMPSPRARPTPAPRPSP